MDMRTRLKVTVYYGSSLMPTLDDVAAEVPWSEE
jgi:hypothetical protein